MININACQVQGILASTVEGSRITTLHARYPRCIHAELMTHRVFGRNARSSRAVPVKVMLAEEPFVPCHWGKNQRGMVAGEEHNATVMISGDLVSRERAWLWAYQNAKYAARAFDDAGYHKQIVNRLLEPFGFIETLITATEWDDFWRLRLSKDAEPHMNDLAMAMKAAYDTMPVQELKSGEWHLPYSDSVHAGSQNNILFMAAARCSRISYKSFDGSGLNPEKDIVDGRNLLALGHASPFDHLAQATEPMAFGTSRWQGRHLQGSSWACSRAHVGL